MSQFRISCFVDDRKLAEALRRLMGLAIGQPEIEPVANAKLKNGKLVERTRGARADMLIAWARENKLEELTAATARQFLESQGFDGANTTNVLAALAEKKHLARLGKKGMGFKARWRVNPAKTAE